MTDRIEKQIFLKAPRSRVWRAISNSKEFGAWFGMVFDAPFTPGAALRGKIIPTQVDAEVAKHQKAYEGKPCEIWVEKVEPERLFSFRWHPSAHEEGVDYSHEPTTLIVFELHDAEGGILLKVTESGFDKIPLERRAQAFSNNEGGWKMVMGLIEKYLARPA